MEDILTKELLMLMAGIFAISFTLRKFLEALFPTLSRATPMTRAQRVWEDFLLPCIPVFVGVGIALIYPFEGMGKTARVLAGAGLGFFCAWVYRLGIKLLSTKFGITEEELNKPIVMPGTVVAQQTQTTTTTVMVSKDEPPS